MNPRVRLDEEKLHGLFAPYDSTSEPGLAVGIAHRGRPVFRRGYGLASVELPLALSPSIRMRIGSTSKHFCCLAVMLLAEEGRLSPDESVRRRLPELPSWAEPITLAQLMSHTAGMRCSVDLIFQTAGIGTAASTREQLDLLFGLDSVNFRPDESWSYCNGGYVLLSEIVERVGGRPYGEFLRERILAPVGMSDTLLRPLDTDLLPNSATLHLPSANGGFRRGVFGVAIRGEGGMVSTVDDMLAWLDHMRAPRIGSAASWLAMRTPRALSNGHSTGYGLGLMSQVYRGVKVIHHAGGVIGGASQMLTAPDLGLDIVIMTNRSGRIDPSALAERVLDLMVGDLAPEAEDSGGAAIAGTFHDAARGRVVSLSEHEGKPLVDLLGTKVPARRAADGSLKVAAPTLAMTIRQVGEAIEVEEWGRRDRYAPVTAPAEDGIGASAGRWLCRAPELEVRVDAGDPATLRFRGPLGSMAYRLSALGPGLWSVSTGDPLMPLGGVLEALDGGLAFTSPRTHRLRFERAA